MSKTLEQLRAESENLSRTIETLTAQKAEADRLIEEAAAKLWEPAENERVFWVLSSGQILQDRFAPSHESFRAGLACKSIQPTQQAAERELLRRRSMKPTIPVPKVGDKVWGTTWSCLSRSIEPRFYIWEGSPLNFMAYNHGRVFANVESAQAWIDQFGPAWTTVEDAE